MAFGESRLQGGGARALWTSTVGEITDEFKAIAGNRFFGFARPLTDAEYGRVLSDLQRKLQALPIIRLDESANGPAGEPKEETPGLSNSQVVVNDAAKAKQLLGEAAELLYLYSRLQNPPQHEINDRLDSVSPQAFVWLKEAKAQHPRELAALAERERAKLPLPGNPGERKADPRAGTPAAPEANPASPANRPPPAPGEAPSTPRWIAFALLACGAVLAIGQALRRKDVAKDFPRS